MTPNTAITKRVLVLMITIMNMTVITIATTTTTMTMARLVPTMMTPDDGDDVNGDDNVENRVTNVDLQQFAAQGPFSPRPFCAQTSSNFPHPSKSSAPPAVTRTLVTLPSLPGFTD